MVQSYLGNIRNKEGNTDVVVGDVAANVTITRGIAIYQDAANGFKIVPTGGVYNNQIRFAEVQQNNNPGARGSKKIETWKHGAVICVKAHGNIPIAAKLRPSTVTAGSLSALANPTNSATGLLIQKYHVADYLGKPNQTGGIETPVTAASNGDEIWVYVL